MSLQYWINIILFSFLTVPYTMIYIKKNELSPVSIFLVMQISMFYGICFYHGKTSVVGTSEVGIKLETIYVCAVIFFILGVEFAKRVKMQSGNSRAKKGTNTQTLFLDYDLSKTQNFIVWGLVIVSIIACSYLLIRGGTNLLTQALRDFVGGSTSVYQVERKAYGSMPGIGYVYQFRVVILPLLATYITFVAKKKRPLLLRAALYIFMIFCILCTGQRNAFVFYVAIIFLYYTVMKKKHNITIVSKKQVAIFASFAFFLLAIMTIANGRISDSDKPFLPIVVSIVERVLFVNQGSALTSFSYIDTQNTVWGYDWLQMLKQILPGQDNYLPVDNISYFIEYRTYAGTNPPCLWGSTWYNFNVIGIVICPFLIGLCYQIIYKRAKNAFSADRLSTLFYVALCVYLGIWVYGTPMSLFNNGVITVSLMRWLVYKAPARRR